MTPATAVVLSVLVAASVTNVVFVSSGGFASWARVVVTKSVLGVGPKLLARTWGPTSFELRLVPIMGYLQFLGANPYEDPPAPAPPRLLWTDAPPLRRVLAFVLAPRLVPLALASIVLGPARAARAVASGLVDVFGAFHGSGALLDEAAGTVAREGFAVLVCVALCKVTSFALLPLPLDLLQAASRTRDAKGVAKVRALVMLATIVLIAAWIVAWTVWAIRGR